MLVFSWNRALQALDLPRDQALFEQLIVCYSEPQRHYHTLQHLTECIEKLIPVLGQSEHPGELEIALWYHDAVYDPKGKDNELQSAVMATQHASLPTRPDECLLVDVDLAILGESNERFDEYERQVRAEYAWVPDEFFRSKRAEILQAFVDRQSIFSTQYFRDKFESQARENLRRSIDLLAG